MMGAYYPNFTAFLAFPHCPLWPLAYRAKAQAQPYTAYTLYADHLHVFAFKHLLDSRRSDGSILSKFNRFGIPWPSGLWPTGPKLRLCKAGWCKNWFK